MKAIFGLLLCVTGVILGIYVGLYVCFIKGIVDVITQVRSTNIDALALAWGVAKIILASTVGTISAFVMIIPGFAMVVSWLDRRY